MIDDPVILTAAYGAVSASLSAVMAKVSPTINGWLRHGLSASAPMAVLFAGLLDGQESVALSGSDLLSAAGLLGVGAISSIAASKAVANKKRSVAN